MKKELIGRIDKADFPELKLNAIAVKIDTGAFTSSIHCNHIEEENGVLHCYFLDSEHPDYNHKNLTFNNYTQLNVRSSNGILQTRFAINTTIKIFGKVHQIDLSLSNRSDMKFPILIGRKFLLGKFIVDPELENLSFKAEEQHL